MLSFEYGICGQWAEGNETPAVVTGVFFDGFLRLLSPLIILRQDNAVHRRTWQRCRFLKDSRGIVRFPNAMSSRTESSAGREELLPTRSSLLGRLRDWEDQASWREFFNTYWKFIYGVAIRSGLSDQEAEDVVQETVLSVAKKMPEFVYDPARCSFKGWLMHVTRLRIKDQLRRRQPAFQQAPAGDRESRETPTVERVADPAAGAELNATWDEEWERNLVDAAMERVKLRVKPEHYQIFYLSAVKGLGTREVAKMLHVSFGQVYLVRHRLAKDVKREVERLKEKPL